MIRPQYRNEFELAKARVLIGVRRVPHAQIWMSPPGAKPICEVPRSEGQRTIAELATRYELHPNVITQWRRQAIEKLARVFDDKGLEVQANRDAEVTKLHAKIGQLVVERDFLAKAFDR
jgi:transposase